jgi:cell division transport system permease protein
MSIGAHASFVRNFKHHATTQIATLAVLIGSFTVLTIAALVHQNVEKFLVQWGDDVRVNVYLKENIQKSDEQIVGEFLQKSGLFKNIQFLTKKDAAAKFKLKVGQYAPGLLSDLEFDNPLPASFEMELASGLKSNIQFSKLLDFIGQLKSKVGVDDVSYGQGWIENYATVLKAFSFVTTVFVVVLLLGCLFVIGNSIGTSVAQRRDEIEIMELFGATRAMILWPFIYEGILIGFLSSLIAIAFSYLLFASQSAMIINELSFWKLNNKIEFLHWSRALMLVILGGALGALGSYLWARRLNTGWAAAESSQR